jgi:hypothetical protein
MTCRKSSVVSRTSLLILVFSCFWHDHAPAQDVQEYYVERGEYFTQSTTNRAVYPLSHELFAYVFPATNGSVTSATLSGPLYLSFTLTQRGGVFQLLDQYLGNIALTRPAPGGAYIFNVATLNQGMRSFKLSVPGVANGIRPIRVANFAEAQAVDTSQPFTLQWDKVPKRGAYDYLALNIIGPDGGQAFSITNIPLAATNLVIPAGTLQPNSDYRGYLYIIHYFRSSVSNAAPPGWAALESRATKFSLETLNPAGVLQFASNPVVVNETNGTATIAVERTQGSQGTVTVDYFTSDGSATSNVNYSPVAGTLVFNPGDTSNSFNVSILNDGATNPPLTLHLSLANATGGATLVTRPHASLTVLDSQSAPGLNVDAFAVGRAELYEQEDALPPDQSSLPAPSSFFATIHPAFAGGVTNAIVQLPNGTSRVLTNNGDVLIYEEDFPSRTTMYGAFHGGKYHLNFDTLSDGSFSRLLALGGERNFSVPWVTNWSQAQFVDPKTPFTLKWTPFAAASTNDFVVVRIRDDSDEYVFRTPGAFAPGALPGKTTSVTIPENTFSYGNYYVVDVEFAKVLVADAKSYPGARGCVLFLHTTEFYLNTISGAP